MRDSSLQGKTFLTCFHHSDLTWQFPYAEYDEIREKQMNQVLDFFQDHPGFCFIIDQAYVLENFLKRNPSRRKEVEKAFSSGNGNLELTGGYTIPDVNLCAGETILRNEMIGREYYEKEFGKAPETASLMDAFGMPMQIPQILSQLGFRYLIPGRTPNPPENLDPDKPFIWEGYGKTAVVVVPNGANVDKSSYVTNVPVLMNEEERFQKTLQDLQKIPGNVLAYYMTEVQMFDEAFFRYLDEVNAGKGKKRKVTFGRFMDYCRTLSVEKLPRYTGEFNPVFSGCYTSRIHVKQKIRCAENALYNAELAAALTGFRPSLEEAWKQLSLGTFHDAACGCHHDSCDRDVDRKLSYVSTTAAFQMEKALGRGRGNQLAVLNPAPYTRDTLIETDLNCCPQGVPVQLDGKQVCFCENLPASGIRNFPLDPVPNPQPGKKVCPEGYSGCTDAFFFDFSGTFPRIRSRRFKAQVFGQERFGEILFRHESGSMWEEEYREIPLGAEHQEEKVVSVEEGPVFIRVTTQGKVKPGRRPISGNEGDYWPGFGSLQFTKEYLFPQHLPYFKLRLKVYFTGYNTKIALRIPVALNPEKASARYDTPFASLVRKPYFEVPYRYRRTAIQVSTHAKGDYPALHWVDYTDPVIGLAVANSGTPGHQIAGDSICISLLRSGTSCKDGTMYPQPGSFENGEHLFEFAFSDHTPEDDGAPIRLGACLNRKPVCLRTERPSPDDGTPYLSVSKDNIVFSAVCPKEETVLVRAYETLGKTTLCELKVRPGTRCYASDIYGNNLRRQDAEKIRFTPYQIRTFVLKGGFLHENAYK